MKWTDADSSTDNLLPRHCSDEEENLYQVVKNKKINKANRGDMRKIHLTRQFFEASGRHGDFLEKIKKTVFRLG